MKVLIVVDMQNDFISGALGTPEAAAIVGNVIKRIENSKGELILFTKDTHGEDYLTTPEGKKLPVPHCIEGSEGWEINAVIYAAYLNNASKIEVSGHIINKPVFGSVALVDYLKSREAEIESIELLGVCTDICVVSNAIMLKNTLLNVPICVNEACCAGVTPQSHVEALNTMRMCQIDVI